MSPDRSLDEFAAPDAPDQESAEADSVEESVEVDSDEVAPNDTDDTATVAPTVSTYSWSPSGAACEACGTTTDRRWRDGDDLVCADCKEW